jgi:hypothetical protein
MHVAGVLRQRKLVIFGLLGWKFEILEAFFGYVGDKDRENYKKLTKMQVTALKLIKSWSFPSGNLLSAFHLNIKF